ncbi:MAG: dihydrolipoamide acetyltransferase family protein [Wenzhouxiangella sp.]
MKVFNLPDLGEGLPDAEIVEWLVSEGDEVKVDDPIVSMETAKAVVEVPSPFTGRIVKFHGGPGDVIKTGAPLAEFEVEGDAGGQESSAEEADEQTGSTGEEASAQEKKPAEEESGSGGQERADSGTVVGNVESSDEVLRERTATVGGVKVTPAVRALARKLKVDLASVEPTGAGGVVTAADVRKAAEEGTAPAKPRGERAEPQPEPRREAPAEREAQRPAESGPRPQPAPEQASGEWEPLRGTRRTMARTMSESHKRVVATTLMDDADIHAWRSGEDVTYRLLRGLAAGARAEPGLNAWYDDEQNMRMIHKGMDVGMAVDTADGLFVARLKGVHSGSREDLRGEINRLKENVKNRSIPPEDLKDYTIMLSNFGIFAGRYATPIINPPCVAIVAAGVLRHEVVPVLGGFEVHRMLPLSLTFDHRAVTGGEAARFLRAMLEDLARAE